MAKLKTYQFVYTGNRGILIGDDPPDNDPLWVAAPHIRAARSFAKAIGMDDVSEWSMTRISDKGDGVGGGTGIDVLVDAKGIPTHPVVTVSGGCAESHAGRVTIIDFDNLKG